MKNLIKKKFLLIICVFLISNAYGQNDHINTILNDKLPATTKNIGIISLTNCKTEIIYDANDITVFKYQCDVIISNPIIYQMKNSKKESVSSILKEEKVKYIGSITGIVTTLVNEQEKKLKTGNENWKIDIKEIFKE